MLKRSRLVFFYEEVANPRHAVTWYESEREKPPFANDDEVSEAAERNGGAHEVQQTRLATAVFCNVVWPEFSEGIVLALGHWKNFGVRRLGAAFLRSDLSLQSK
jgi:hypothetical protein